MQRALGGLDPLQPGNYPGGEILRRETAAGGCDVISCKEGLVQYFDTGLFDPWFCNQIGTRRHIIQDAELCKHQGARALSAQELARRIKLHLGHQRPILDDISSQYTATHDDTRKEQNTISAKTAAPVEPEERSQCALSISR